MDEIRGTIQTITYHSEQNGFTVAKLRVENSRPDELIPIVGHLPAIRTGESLILKGSWSQHKQFGMQFNFQEYQIVYPTTLAGMERYLASGFIKGLGPKLAQRIIQYFGEESLSILDQHINRLKEVEGLGEKKIRQIEKSWQEHKAVQNIMIFLQGHQLSSSLALKIYKHYRNQAVVILKDNPYRMVTEVQGIGFIKADEVAKKFGIESHSSKRIEAGLYFLLQKAQEEGHTYLPEEKLIQRTQEILGIEPALIIFTLDHLSMENKLVRNQQSIYLPYLYQCEIAIAKKLLLLKDSPVNPLPAAELKSRLHSFEQQEGLTLSDLQKEAIEDCFKNKVLVITGGPGTGKTTTLRILIKLLLHYRISFSLTAPTGRAAKRLSEATKASAQTIHRLLEYSPQLSQFQRNHQNPLKTNCLIVDEMSMVDVLLFNALLTTLRPGTLLIMVGDQDQLPSVGPGNILKEIIHSELFTVIQLKTIFRQKENGYIAVNAHRIMAGQFPALPNSAESDFQFIEESDPEKVNAEILKQCKSVLPQQYGLDPIQDIQVLTCMYKGINGADALNQLLQQELNNNHQPVQILQKKFKLSDKVMQVRNNYDKMVFNGDIGKIIAIDTEQQELAIQFEDIVSYDFQEIDDLVLSYAITIHKSQGSEYPVVILPLMTSQYIMLQRNLLYTAISRAKKRVVVIGTTKALYLALKNDKVASRYTSLSNGFLQATQPSIDRPLEKATTHG